MRQIEIQILKQLQNEILLCREKNPRLESLHVFIHSDGLIRIKTKIFEGKDEFSFLCPIVLDYKNEIVELMIRETHEELNHAGIQTVMLELREQF